MFVIQEPTLYWIVELVYKSKCCMTVFFFRMLTNGHMYKLYHTKKHNYPELRNNLILESKI